MATTQYVALLRGINVGGGNIIRMADLKACLETNRFANVATYIQSGNVLFESPETDVARLTKKLEKILSGAFSPYEARVVVCSHAALEQIVSKAPRGFGTQPQKFRCDVIFLKDSVTATEAIKSVPTNPAVDSVLTGPGVLYFSRLAAKASQSRLSRLTSLPVYKHMTIRNWNTTNKLLALMDGRTG